MLARLAYTLNLETELLVREQDSYLEAFSAQLTSRRVTQMGSHSHLKGKPIIGQWEDSDSKWDHEVK